MHTFVEFTSVLGVPEGKPLIGQNILLLLISKKIKPARAYLHYISFCTASKQWLALLSAISLSGKYCLGWNAVLNTHQPIRFLKGIKCWELIYVWGTALAGLTVIALISDSCPEKVCLHIPSLISHSWKRLKHRDYYNRWWYTSVREEACLKNATWRWGEPTCQYHDL